MGRKDFVMRAWTYFRKGHSTYFVFVFGVINFVLIVYTFLISLYIEIALEIFVILFTVIYIPTAILVGVWDFKKGAFATDMRVGGTVNPWVNDLAMSFVLVIKGLRNRGLASREMLEAQQILEKWIGDKNEL